MDDFKILFQAVLDSKNIGESDIQRVQKTLDKYTINLTADLDKAKLLKTIKVIVPELEAELKKITGINIEINDKTLVKAINQVEKATQKATAEQNKLTEAMAKGREQAELQAQSEKKRQEIAQNKDINKALNQEYESRQKLIQSTDEQALKIRQLNSDGSIQLSFDKISTQYEKLDKLGLITKELKINFDQLTQSFNSFNPNNKSRDAVLSYNKLNSQMKLVQNTMSSIVITAPKITKEISTIERQTLENQIKAWMRVNSNAKDFFVSLEAILSKIQSVDAVEFTNLKKKFAEVKTEAAAAGVLGKNFKDTMTAAIQKFSEWGLSTSLVMNAVQSVKNMGKAVYDIDTAMTSLYKVTDETDDKYNQFLKSACLNAEELGRTVSSLIDQTATWAKLGYSLEQSSELAKVSSIYANVGEVDDATAVSDLVTTMKAYNIAADQAISIVDKYNKLGNEFATSSKDLGEGMSNAASMLALGGTDMNKALALLTGGAEITQSAGELGNALKIGQMRVQGMKGKLEELGETIDENVESISKMQTHILNLTSGKVNIFDENNNFKDYYDILEEISEVYDELSSTDRADLLETMFGKNRGNQGAAVIQAFQSGQVQKALEATMNAEGSAMQEQERWLGSLEAKTQQFEASFQSLANTLIDSDILKFFVDLGTTGVNAINSIISAITPLGTLGVIGGGVGITKFIKNLDWPKTQSYNKSCLDFLVGLV